MQGGGVQRMDVRRDTLRQPVSVLQNSTRWSRQRREIASSSALAILHHSGAARPGICVRAAARRGRGGLTAVIRDVPSSPISRLRSRVRGFPSNRVLRSHTQAQTLRIHHHNDHHTRATGAFLSSLPCSPPLARVFLLPSRRKRPLVMLVRAGGGGLLGPWMPEVEARLPHGGEE